MPNDMMLPMSDVSTEMPVISLKHNNDGNLGRQLGDSFADFGFAIVSDHGLDQSMVETAWDYTQTLFAMPADLKRRAFSSDIAGARGYTPFKTEIAKGAEYHDLKEFWHIGRDLPAGSPLRSSMPDNIWPEGMGGFAEHFAALYCEFDRLGAKILSAIARYLGLQPDWFDDGIADGNSVLRLLHYPPIGGDAGGAIRAGAHEDINLITLLLGASDAGLQIKRTDGRWMSVSPPPGALAVNVGDMLQRLTNNMLPSTTHRVINPSGLGVQRSRYSMPFFLHLRSDFEIVTLPECISADNPNLYPEAILANDYLKERLIEIGLLKE